MGVAMWLFISTLQIDFSFTSELSELYTCPTTPQCKDAFPGFDVECIDLLMANEFEVPTNPWLCNMTVPCSTTTSNKQAPIFLQGGKNSSARFFGCVCCKANATLPTSSNSSSGSLPTTVTLPSTTNITLPPIITESLMTTISSMTTVPPTTILSSTNSLPSTTTQPATCPKSTCCSATFLQGGRCTERALLTQKE